MWDQEFVNNFRENGRKIAEIKARAIQFAQTHLDLADVDSYVDTLIQKAGGEAGFKKVPGYRWATCINVNDGIVHGIPKGKIKAGDIVNIDTGMFYKGTTTDTSITFVIGQPSPDQEQFLSVGKKTLHKTIQKARSGKQIWDLSETMQRNIEVAGFNVTRNLTGHGVGKTMHEEPMIPCFTSKDPALKTRIEVGMVLAIEVMYMKGDWPLVLQPDGWTLKTRDHSWAAVFEEDVLVTPTGPEVLTDIRE